MSFDVSGLGATTSRARASAREAARRIMLGDTRTFAEVGVQYEVVAYSMRDAEFDLVHCTISFDLIREHGDDS